MEPTDSIITIHCCNYVWIGSGHFQLAVSGLCSHYYCYIWVSLSSGGRRWAKVAGSSHLVRRCSWWLVEGAGWVDGVTFTNGQGRSCDSAMTVGCFGKLATHQTG